MTSRLGVVSALLLLTPSCFSTSCRTCKDEGCLNQEILVIACNKNPPILPFQTLPHKDRENLHYACLELEYIEGDIIRNLQQCILAEEIKKFCPNIAQSLNVVRCSVDSTHKTRLKRETFLDDTEIIDGDNKINNFEHLTMTMYDDSVTTQAASTKSNDLHYSDSALEDPVTTPQATPAEGQTTTDWVSYSHEESMSQAPYPSSIGFDESTDEVLSSSVVDNFNIHNSESKLTTISSPSSGEVANSNDLNYSNSNLNDETNSVEDITTVNSVSHSTYEDLTTQGMNSSNVNEPESLGLGESNDFTTTLSPGINNNNIESESELTTIPLLDSSSTIDSSLNEPTNLNDLHYSDSPLSDPVTTPQATPEEGQTIDWVNYSHEESTSQAPYPSSIGFDKSTDEVLSSSIVANFNIHNSESKLTTISSPSSGEVTKSNDLNYSNLNLNDETNPVEDITTVNSVTHSTYEDLTTTQGLYSLNINEPESLDLGVSNDFTTTSSPGNIESESELTTISLLDSSSTIDSSLNEPTKLIGLYYSDLTLESLVTTELAYSDDTLTTTTSVTDYESNETTDPSDVNDFESLRQDDSSTTNEGAHTTTIPDLTTTVLYNSLNLNYPDKSTTFEDLKPTEPTNSYEFTNSGTNSADLASTETLNPSEAESESSTIINSEISDEYEILSTQAENPSTLDDLEISSSTMNSEIPDEYEISSTTEAENPSAIDDLEMLSPSESVDFTTTQRDGSFEVDNLNIPDSKDDLKTTITPDDLEGSGHGDTTDSLDVTTRNPNSASVIRYSSNISILLITIHIISIKLR